MSPQLADFSRAWRDEDGITFEILTDLGNGVARDYGLVFRVPDYLREAYVSEMNLDLSRFNGDESWELAVPATYVISPGGEVAWVSAHPDYTRRSEPADVLEAVQQLARP